MQQERLLSRIESDNDTMQNAAKPSAIAKQTKLQSQANSSPATKKEAYVMGQKKAVDPAEAIKKAEEEKLKQLMELKKQKGLSVNKDLDKTQKRNELNEFLT